MSYQVILGFGFALCSIGQYSFVPPFERHHRPDQGRACGDPERSLGCGFADHHRSHGGRTAEEERRRRWRHASGRRHGRHGFLIQPFKQAQQCKTPAAMPGFLFERALIARLSKTMVRHSGARRSWRGFPESRHQLNLLPTPPGLRFAPSGLRWPKRVLICNRGYDGRSVC